MPWDELTHQTKTGAIRRAWRMNMTLVGEDAKDGAVTHCNTLQHAATRCNTQQHTTNMTLAGEDAGDGAG